MTISISPQAAQHAAEWYKKTYGGIEQVPKKYWPGVLRALKGKETVEEGYGTHCYNEVYNLNGWLYDLTFQNGSTRPIDITRKKA